MARRTRGYCVGQGHLKTVARELARYKLDLVGVQEVTWNSGGKERAEDTFSVEMEMKIIRDTILCRVHHRRESAVKRV